MVKPNRTKDRTYSPPGPPLRSRPGKAHALAITHVGNRTSLGGRVGFDYPVVQEGQTAHFVAYYDPSLGPNGKSCADGELAVCENDYAQTSAWFGGIDSPTLPFNIVLAALDPSGQGGGGAYHYGCSAVDLYCDVKNVPAQFKTSVRIYDSGCLARIRYFFTEQDSVNCPAITHAVSYPAHKKVETEFKRACHANPV